MTKPRDITGQKFGKLTAICLDVERTVPNKRYWWFDCDCGKRVSIKQGGVTSGNTSSCGCIKLREDLTGKRFTRLTVIERVGQNKSGDSMWKCVCDCGNERVVAGGHLLGKIEPTRSCGCWSREQLVEKSTTHGMSSSPEFKLWGSIKSRCKPDGLYGKRGIFMHPEWEESFEVFYQYLKDTIGLRPSPKHQLDRVAGGNSPYAPSNVRWLTSKENNRNRTNNRILEFDGQQKTLSEWAENYQINRDTLSDRLVRGWTVEDALTKPLRPKKVVVEPKQIEVLPDFDYSKIGNRGKHGFVDLTGKRFGMLIVTRRVEKNVKRQVFWEAQCECGNTGVWNARELKNGSRIHCGCQNSRSGKNLITHGLSNTPEYQVWAGINHRCRNVAKYRDRGIQVQEEWRESFLAFRSYLVESIGLRPSPDHQLDRIAGGSSWYCEFNLRWCLPTDNMRNQTTNRLITFQNRTQNLSSWAEEVGIKPGTLRQRLENGWSVEKALTTPLRVR